MELIGNFPKILISLGLAFSATVFWIFFWYYFSRKYTTSRKALLGAFIIGVGAAVLAAFFERIIFPKIFPGSVFSIFRPESGFVVFEKIIFSFGAVFFLAALPEEIIKFFSLKLSFLKFKNFNQIVDGIKFGLILGLGFAIVENSFFFFEQLDNFFGSIRGLLSVFLFRFFITTLIHSLYGGILGYYFGLSRFYKVFKNIFLWQGFLFAVLIHTIFNFLVLTPLNIFIFLIILVFLSVLLKWYTDRRSFQEAVFEQLSEKIKLPMFAEKKEVQALLFEGTSSNFRILKKIGLCPFCFKKIKKDSVGAACQYCGLKFPNLIK